MRLGRGGGYGRQYPNGTGRGGGVSEAKPAAFIAQNVSNRGQYSFSVWIMDSGSTDHLTSDLLCLRDLKLLDPPLMVEIGNGKWIPATGKGTACLTLMTGMRIQLSNTLLVPQLSGNLFSI